MTMETSIREATQPMHITLIRHGESEANRVQKDEKAGIVSPYADEVYSRHDYEHHLTRKGVLQAKAARMAMIEEGIVPEEYYDAFYTSQFTRPIETFAYLTNGMANAIAVPWLNERDWGEYGNTPLHIRRERFIYTENQKKRSTFMTRYDGGENMPDVAVRLKPWIETINREQTDRRVLAVVHGELMWTARFLFEGLTLQQWEEMDGDDSLRIGNCCRIDYSRVNPEDPTDISRTISGGWRKMTDANVPERSPYNGEWVKMPGRTLILGREALAAAEAYVRIDDEHFPSFDEVSLNYLLMAASGHKDSKSLNSLLQEVSSN